MKIPVNLASQPFRRDRAMLAASLAVCALLVFTLGVLVSLALADRAQLKDVRAEVGRLNSDIRKVSTQQAQYDAILRKPENADVLYRSVFLNELLLRKGISWTRIFADLEKVLPYNVRIIQIHPNVDARNHVVLDMQVGSESPEPVIEFLKALQQPPFGRPVPRVQQPPTQAEPLYRYRVSVDYAQKLP
jgi:type IV pilus assembly protein PilN